LIVGHDARRVPLNGRRRLDPRDLLNKQVEELEEKLSAANAAPKKACPPPEAGVSVNVNFTLSTDGVTLTGGQITLRGEKHADALDVLATLSHIISEKKWKFAKAPTAAPPPEPNKAVEIARESGNAQALAEVKQAAERVPDPPAGKTWQTLDAARVIVIPQPDGRIKIEFYEDGHKFPDLKTTWKADQVAGLLKHVTSHDVTKPADLALPCRVYYTLGKEYTSAQTGQTGNYKDIAHVRPL